jgi:hypothetical protein
MLGILKKIFSKQEVTLSALTAVSESEEPNELTNEFKKEYQEKSKKVKTSEEFQKFAVDLIVNKIKETEYGKHQEFLNEIKYFVYYLFLVVKDDYTHGDKICQQTLTQFDNYIFSAYRKRPKLSENIRKFSLLASSKRFTETPKENILSYFVFLEEHGIELVELLQDYTDILDNKKISKVPEKMAIGKKSYSKDETLDSLHTVAPSMQNFNHKIIPKNLDKE